MAAATNVAFAGPMPFTTVRLSTGQDAKLFKQPCANSSTSFARDSADRPLWPVPNKRAINSRSFRTPNPSWAARAQGRWCSDMAQKKPAVQDNGFKILERRLGVDVQRLDTYLVKLDFKLAALFL